MRFAILSALATRKQASPIGFLSEKTAPPFALLDATQELHCPTAPVAAADAGQRGWVGSDLDTQWMLKEKKIALCYRNGCLIQMQLAQFYGSMLYHQCKPLHVL